MTMFKSGLLKGKRILITGGGTGLGKEMADEYAKLGAEVYICGRRGPVVEETAKEMSKAHNTRVTALECDIRVADAVDDMMTRVFNEQCDVVADKIKILTMTIPASKTETDATSAGFDQSPGNQQMIIASRCAIVLIFVRLAVAVARDNLWIFFG